MLKRFFDKLRSPSSQQDAPPRGAAPRVPEPSAAPPSKPTTLEESQAYLGKVQEKINKLAEEFAAGAINRGQFQELYDHYRREQQTVKRWIEMDPKSEAWKELTTEGKSVVIRQQYTAKVMGYAIYENESGMPLSTIGEFEVEPDLFVPMLSSYRAATQEIFGAGMSSTEIEGGRRLSFVPGEFTTLMALFSSDPAPKQMDSLEELHLLFERANRTLLSQESVDPDELVFPHSYFLGRMQ
jgi:hypothetical protein